MKLRNRQKIYGIISIILVTLSLVFFNALVREFDVKIDVTEDEIFTVSDGSRKIFEELEATVMVRFYITRQGNAFPTSLRDYAVRVEDLLRELEEFSQGKFKLKVMDPEPDSLAEEQAEQDGVIPQTYSGDPVYFGLSFTCIDNQRAIPFLFPEREAALEYEIMKRVSEVSAFEKPRIGLMSALPLKGGRGRTAASGSRIAQFPKWFVLRELEKTYDIVSLDLDLKEIPEDLNCLIALHPAGASEATEKALDRFVQRGGNLLLLIDPAAMIPTLIDYQGKVPLGSNFPTLLKAWGVSLEEGKMVTDWRYLTPMGSAAGSLESLTILSLDADALNRKSSLIGAVDLIALPYAGSLQWEIMQGLELTPLMTSSDQSSTCEVNGFKPMNPASMAMVRDRFLSSGEKKTLALGLKGIFPPAFDDTPQIGDMSSSVILVADSDFLYDAFCVQETKSQGETVAVPLNGNVSFFMSAVASLSGSDHLAQVRNRELIKRPFLRIEEIESQAREQFEKRIKGVEDELRQVDGALSDFGRQAAHLGDGRSIPIELQQQLQQQKAKRRGLMRQLKEIRFQLRRDIHRLENRLKWLNIVAVPVLVILFGIVFALIRNRKTSLRP